MKHLKRKQLCAAIISDIPIQTIREQYDNNESKAYQCVEDGCNKSFSSQSGLYYHKRACHEQQTIDYLQERLIRLETLLEVKNGGGDTNNTTNNNGDTTNTNIVGDHNQNANNITNNTVEIHVHNFGNENKDYITTEFARQCLEMGAFGIQLMLDRIYFSDEHPENHNVRLRSLKNSLVEVLKDKRWECRGLNDTIETMINKSSSEIIVKTADILQHNPTEENLMNATAISNINPVKRSRMHEKTKSKLIQRRTDYEDGVGTTTSQM